VDNRSTNASIDPTGSITEHTNDSDGSQGQGDREQSDSNESATSLPGGRTMTTSIGSWKSGASSGTWCAVYDNFPQLQLLIGLLKVNGVITITQFGWIAFEIYIILCQMLF